MHWLLLLRSRSRTGQKTLDALFKTAAPENTGQSVDSCWSSGRAAAKEIWNNLNLVSTMKTLNITQCSQGEIQYLAQQLFSQMDAHQNRERVATLPTFPCYS